MIVRAALIGLGSVNRNLLRLLSERSERVERDYGVTFQIVAVADSSGFAVQPKGFDLAELLAQKEQGVSAAQMAGGVLGKPVVELIKHADVDLVFEGSPVDLKTGGTGLALTKAALERGVSVVLANKAPIVLEYDALHRLARTNDCHLKYSATFCGGLPVLNVIDRDMVAGQISEVRGVFNATSNFVLDEMARGSTFDAALSEAQDRGIAEADPSLDVEGWDTANKLLILANSVWGGFTIDDLSVQGISGLGPIEIERSRENGKVIKLVATGTPSSLEVKPVALDASDFLAGCEGWEMGVQLKTDIYGINSFKLWEREPVPTAASMLRDAVALFDKHKAR